MSAEKHITRRRMLKAATVGASGASLLPSCCNDRQVRTFGPTQVQHRTPESRVRS